MFEFISPELTWLAYSGIGLGAWAISTSKREKIKERDKQCSYPDCLRGDPICERFGICTYDECQEQADIHHITPKKLCRDKKIEPDRPENLLLVGEVHSTLIHPPVRVAEEEWGVSPDEFNFRCTIPLSPDERGKPRRIPIHPDARVHQEMQDIAEKRTQRAKKRGMNFW